MSESSSQPRSSCFVAKLDLKSDPALAGKLKQLLEEQGFILDKPLYTLFSGKKKGVSCALYESGKLTVQGKEMAQFIEFHLETEILKSFDFTYAEIKEVDLTPRIGIDESGKGDFFGPLCIAGVYAGNEEVRKLVSLGVRDSKTLGDPKILKLAEQIRDHFKHEIIAISPLRYNELYQKFGNLNHLLAWGHATVATNLIDRVPQCALVTIDQFAGKHVVENALKKKNFQAELRQQHKGEADVVIAAASILARAAFVLGLEKLGKEVEIILPKGASKLTIAAGKTIVANFGAEALGKVGKLHFKTFNDIVGTRL